MDSKLKCVFEEGSADASPKVCLILYVPYVSLNLILYFFTFRISKASYDLPINYQQ